jgi:transcriptional regulator with XRE-family HTH domain
MSKFSPTFREGDLALEIAIRGLSQEEFATKAGLDPASIRKAIRGKRLQPRTWGKIQIALGALPVPELPAGLVEDAV